MSTTLSIAIRDFGAEELVEVLSNSGYEHSMVEFNSSEIRYRGLNSRHQHVFVISFLDDVDEHYVTRLFVTTNSAGLIVGEWSSMPHLDGLTEREVELYFAGMDEVLSAV